MNSFLLSAVLAIALVHAVTAVRYDGYKVFKVTPHNMEQVQKLADLYNCDGVLFASEPTKLIRNSSIAVSPSQQETIANTMRAAGLDFQETAPDLQQIFDSEPAAKEGTPFYWDRYYRLDAINNFLTTVTQENHRIAYLINIGKSYEGRDMYVVKVSRPGKPNKKAIFMDANIHAREHVTAAVMTYFLNELIYNPNYVSWAEDFDFYLIPMANPDGYEYTWLHDRLWRKTRSPTPNPNCFGADPNRNWDFRWMEGGASSEPCHITYAGESAFSESETIAISNFVKSISNELVFFGSVHSYGQMILTPYGVEGVSLPEAEGAEYTRIAERMISEMARKFGTTYVSGTITELVNASSGSSMDWAKGKLGTHLTLSFELRGGGGSDFGFNLPAAQILPTAIEFMDSFQIIVDELRQKFVSTDDKSHSSLITGTLMVTIVFTLMSVCYNVMTTA